MGDLLSFTIETFAPLVGETFLVHPEDSSPVEAELISAMPYGGQSAGGRAPFSIVFRGPSQPVFAQMTYRMEHAALGSFELFIVPIGPDETGMRYEAVFA
jgi:hypothetical protein